MCKNFKSMGNVYGHRDVKIIKIKEGIFALYGWDGERYTDCWKLKENLIDAADNKKYIIESKYRKNAEDEFEIIAFEIIA